MKKSILAVFLVASLLLIPITGQMGKDATGIQFITVTSDDRIAAREIVQSLVRVKVSHKHMVNGSIGETTLTESDYDSILTMGPITYKPDFVVNKGLYAAEIDLENKKRMKAGVSVYGQFFVVEGIKGYFEYEAPEMSQAIIAKDYRIAQLEDLLSKVGDVVRLSGTVQDMRVLPGGTIQIQIKTKDQQADENNLLLEVPKSCGIYFVDNIGLQPSTLEAFMEKTESELSEPFYDQYTFIFVKGRLAQIVQGNELYE